MRPKTSIGRLSDLAEKIKPRVDWSGLVSDLKALNPGEVLSVRCPHGVTMSQLRSTILTYGHRIHNGDYSVSTRSYKNVVHVFLVRS